MFKTLLNVALAICEEVTNKQESKNEQIITLIKEIEELEVKRAKEVARAKMFGCDDESNWMMGEANRLKMAIEAKERALKALKEL